MIPLEIAPLSDEIVKITLTALGSLLAGSGVGYVWGERVKRKSIVGKYREFIAYSAWALQERIDNILERDFASFYIEKEGERNVYANNALNYTLFLFCQFFAWREIINREMYNFRFRKCGYDSRILLKLIAVEHWFSTSDGIKGDDFSRDMFMIFRGEQRVLGDLCVKFNKDTNVYECIGFSDFIKKRKEDHIKEDACYLSIDRLEEDIENLLQRRKEDIERKHRGHYIRLAVIRDSLLDLLDELDPKKQRHPEHRGHYKIPYTGNNKSTEDKKPVFNEYKYQVYCPEVYNKTSRR